MRARAFVPGAGRMAHENLLTAGRLAGARGVVRTFNPDLTDMRIEEKPRYRARRIHGALKRPVELATRYVVGGKERHADGVEAGRNRDPLSCFAVACRVRNILVPIE